MKRKEYNINGMKLCILHNAKDVNLQRLIDIIEVGMLNDYKDEGSLRLALQRSMDFAQCPVLMLLNGNTVWPYTKTMRDFRKVVKANDTIKMTNHLYSFFHLCCGTIAHYNKHGWANAYTDNDALKDLFRRNEYGHSVVNGMPRWETDAILIAKEMEEILNNEC